MQLPYTADKFFCKRYSTLIGVFCVSVINRGIRRFCSNFYFRQILFFFMGKQVFPAVVVFKNFTLNIK